RPFIFTPLSRYGVGVAVCAVFFVSGIVHLLLVFMATGKWGISLSCGAFFVVQLLFLKLERSFKVRTWTRIAGWTWTVGALTVTSPLFVEPIIQLLERSWGSPDEVLLPTLIGLGFVFVLCFIVILATVVGFPRNAGHSEMTRALRTWPQGH